MLATVEDVKELTNYDVTLEEIRIAQGIVEAFLGKTEIEVTDPSDKMFVSRAVCYQSAYVKKNYTTVFEQVAVRSISGPDNGMTLDVDLGSPYLAPLAAFTLRNVSTKASRSVKTGSMWGTYLPVPWEMD